MNKTTAALKLAEEAMTSNMRLLGAKALAAIREALAEPVKQEVTDVLNVALEALVYHTEQTRPIHKTDEAISQIQNFLDKGETK